MFFFYLWMYMSHFYCSCLNNAMQPISNQNGAAAHITRLVTHTQMWKKKVTKSAIAFHLYLQERLIVINSQLAKDL